MSKLLRGSRKVPTPIDLSVIEVKSKVTVGHCWNPYKQMCSIKNHAMCNVPCKLGGLEAK